MAPKQCALTHLTVSFHRAVQGTSFLIQNLGERGYYESKNVTLQRWQMPTELRNLVPPEVLSTPTEDHLALSTASALTPAKPPSIPITYLRKPEPGEDFGRTDILPEERATTHVGHASLPTQDISGHLHLTPRAGFQFEG